MNTVDPVLDEPTRRLPSQRVRVIALAEVALASAFYQWYSAARHWVEGSPSAALRNAVHVISVERALGIFNEAGVQASALAHSWAARAVSVYYGVAHFAVPVVALMVLFFRDRRRFRVYRNAFAIMSVLAVVVFAVWPLMPPRLLPPEYRFVDVLAIRAPAPALDRSVAPQLYNGFAAMPSLHFAYALWSTLALWPLLRRLTLRAALVAHPVLTTVAVVVTGNHYYLDAFGGALVLFGGLALAAKLRFGRTRLEDPRLAVVLAATTLAIWLPKRDWWMTLENVVLVVTLAVLVGRSMAPPPEEVPARAELPGQLVGGS